MARSFGISDGKETGSLGWESTKGEAGATAKAAAPLEDLAQNVVDQRDKIISDVIEKVAIPLECPVDKRPQPTVLNNLNEYASGLEAFSAFVRARVARDNNLKSQLNQVLRLLNVREAYSGRITVSLDAFSASERPVLPIELPALADAQVTSRTSALRRILVRSRAKFANWV